MSIRTSSLLTAHYPNTYMEQFCKALHPEIELDTICVSWFRQATKHCIELMNDIQTPSSYIWTTVKNFIFPERSSELLSKKIPISIHPNRLSAHDCQSIFLDIVNDYIERAPRFAADSKTNVMLWQVLYSLVGIMVMSSILMGTIYIYNKYGTIKQMYNPLNEFFKPEKRLQAVAKRSLHFAKAEVRLLEVPQIVKPEELIAPDGTKILVLKVSRKFDFINSIVMSSLSTSGRLYRLYDPYNNLKSEHKTESLTNALKFLENNCKKLRLLLIFEDESNYEGDVIESRKNKSLQSQSPPVHSPFTKSTSTAFGFGSSSPRSNIPKQGTTPRAGAIPRNTVKRAPRIIAKKFK